MTEQLTQEIYWQDLYNPIQLHLILHEFTSINNIEISIDLEKRKTLIEYTKKRPYESLPTQTMREGEIIPNEVTLFVGEHLKYYKIKAFKLENYPQILNFVEEECPYIHEFIEDQGITEIEIAVQKKIRLSDFQDAIETKLLQFNKLKNWLLKDQNIEIIPLIFIALMRKFYRQETRPFTISSLESPILERIIQYSDYVNSLFNVNKKDIQTYSSNSDIYSNLFDNDLFKIFGNNITHEILNLAMYQNNMDLKFMGYISLPKLREYAINLRS